MLVEVFMAVEGRGGCRMHAGTAVSESQASAVLVISGGESSMRGEGGGGHPGNTSKLEIAACQPAWVDARPGSSDSAKAPRSHRKGATMETKARNVFVADVLEQPLKNILFIFSFIVSLSLSLNCQSSLEMILCQRRSCLFS